MFKLRPQGHRAPQRPVSRGGSAPSHTSTNRTGEASIIPARPSSPPPHRSPGHISTNGHQHTRATGRGLAEFDRALSKFENLPDISFLPDMHIIVRLDAHRLGIHWASFPDADYPLGASFSQGLRAAAVALFTSGIRILFIFAHGDELSVAIDPQELINGRKKARLVSGLASAASVGLCTALGRGALFHAKVSELPSSDHVIDYLLWQRLVARRNTIARFLSLKLAEAALPKSEVDRILTKAGEEERLATLSHFGLDYASLTPYQHRGALLWWASSPIPSSIRIEGQPFGIAECVDLPEEDEFVMGIRAILRGVSISTEGEAPVFQRELPRENLTNDDFASDGNDESEDDTD
jgi:tRNA(His) 5'-end guanylyltransferase